MRRNEFIKRSSAVSVLTFLGIEHLTAQAMTKKNLDKIGLGLFSLSSYLEKNFEGCIEMLSKNI